MIHVEVKKLYPDALLPRFTSKRISEDELLMTYESVRHMEDLAVGLIKGCFRHFDQKAEVGYARVSDDVSEIKVVRLNG